MYGEILDKVKLASYAEWKAAGSPVEEGDSPLLQSNGENGAGP